MINNLGILQNPEPYTSNKIIVGNGQLFSISAVGSSFMTTPYSYLRLYKVYHDHDLSRLR